jgi:hypothetical protein
MHDGGHNAEVIEHRREHRDEDDRRQHNDREDKADLREPDLLAG